MNSGDGELSGKTAVITGAGRGIGRGIAETLARAGARVVINYLEHEVEAENAVRQLNEFGAEAFAIRADVRTVRGARKLVSRSATAFGRLDIWINNVGTFIYKPVDRLTTAEWRETMNSNLTSVFFCCREVLPLMRRQKGGRIVNIALANAGAPKAFGGATAYAIAKTGVLILTRSLAVQEAPYNITVNAVSPGLMDNGSLNDRQRRSQARRIPAGRSGTPADVAEAVLFLVGLRADYITGANLRVSGGWGL